MADLYENLSNRKISLAAGFSFKPGEKVTLPQHVVDHPGTQMHVRAGRLAVVVEAKRTRAKKEPETVEEAPEGDEITQ